MQPHSNCGFLPDPTQIDDVLLFLVVIATRLLVALARLLDKQAVLGRELLAADALEARWYAVLLFLLFLLLVVVVVVIAAAVSSPRYESRLLIQRIVAPVAAAAFGTATSHQKRCCVRGAHRWTRLKHWRWRRRWRWWPRACPCAEAQQQSGDTVVVSLRLGKRSCHGWGGRRQHRSSYVPRR